MATQTNPTNQITDQMNKQMEQMFGLADMCRTQTEKTMDFWMSQSVEAAKESQKMTKEWVSTGKTLGEQMVKAYQDQTKEIVKLFTPAA